MPFVKGKSGFEGQHWNKNEKKRIGRERNIYWKSKGNRKRQSLKLKKYTLSHPDVIDKKVAAAQKYLAEHPEVIKNRNEAIRKAYRNTDLKKKIARKLRLIYKNPEIRKKVDRAVTSWWKEHPNIKKIYAIRAKKYFILHPDKFKKFLDGGKNASKLHIMTKQRFLVRSAGEKKIADFLFLNRVECEYESRTLILDGWLCTPDFYLPKENMFIEFYGGHPKSWKKKVIKNKLYRKHKIPCIFITPAELLDLDYYLLNEIEKKAD